MNNLDNLYPQWKDAISALPWGVAKAFKNVFELAAEGKTHLVYGSDYRDNSPCLVNTVGVMLQATGGSGGHGLPSKHFGDVVHLFDSINRELANADVNVSDGLVSPLAADIFLRHFPDIDALKDEAARNYEESRQEAIKRGEEVQYVEPTDEEMASAIASLFTDTEPSTTTIDDDLNIRVDLNDQRAWLGNFNFNR